jgi:hypothetical protein
MTAQKPARLLDVCVALDRKPKIRRKGETRDWRFPGNWIRRLSRTGGWQATQPRQTSADQQRPRCTMTVSVISGRPVVVQQGTVVLYNTQASFMMAHRPLLRIIPPSMTICQPAFQKRGTEGSPFDAPLSLATKCAIQADGTDGSQPSVSYPPEESNPKRLTSSYDAPLRRRLLLT